MGWKNWLGDLDSNQDSQIQNLESYQLDDLPAEGAEKGKPDGALRRLHFNLTRIKRAAESVNTAEDFVQRFRKTFARLAESNLRVDLHQRVAGHGAARMADGVAGLIQS